MVKKSLVLLFLFSFAICLIGYSDDLATAAKKEKARREALAKEGKKGKTYTDADLERLRPKTETTPEPVYINTADIEEKEISPLDKQIADLKQERDRVSKELDETRAAIAKSSYHSTNIGSLYQTARQQEERLKELDKQIADLEKQ